MILVDSLTKGTVFTSRCSKIGFGSSVAASGLMVKGEPTIDARYSLLEKQKKMYLSNIFCS